MPESSYCEPTHIQFEDATDVEARDESERQIRSCFVLRCFHVNAGSSH